MKGSEKTITIVGGGSSGWMTAIYLQRRFANAESPPHIRLIESEDIGIIGVGEATVHSIRFFFAAMGLDENELIRRTDATLKTGVLFKNWRQGEHDYFHPFEQQASRGGVDLPSLWLCSAGEERYDASVSAGYYLMRANKTPKTPRSQPYQGIIPYGYHLDATKMASYLREVAKERGVEHVLATVQDVDVDVDGETIRAVETTAGRFDGDLFIDCTGFRALLISKVASDNWVSYEDELPCNRAVAIQTELPGEPRSYTTATALSNGWAWQIDLQTRSGTGYVYDGNRQTPEEAEEELLKFLGSSEVKRKVHLRMRVGRSKQFWVGNVVAVGLSGGFIEPLESTGLHLVNLGVGLLATHLTQADITERVRASYNRLMTGFYEELREFIVLHYCLTNREDSAFWKSAKSSSKSLHGLNEKLELWQSKVCEFQDFAGGYNTTFSDENYRYVLYGMEHLPVGVMSYDEDLRASELNQLKDLSERAVQQTLSPRDFFERISVC